MPLLFDMPWEKLQTYNGSNPKPNDHNVFWEKALKEMNDVEPKPELIPSDFKCSFADCFDLFFTGVGGARIHAKFARPKKIEAPIPAVLKFHGYSANCGDWADLLLFAAEGFVVAALDCRGQGGLSEDIGGITGTTFNGHIIRGLNDEPEKLLFRQIFLDTALLAKIIMDMPEVDREKIGATGGSQGGGLTLACASLVPEIKLAAPVFPFLSDYKRVWEMDLAKDAYHELQFFFRTFDPQHHREDEIFTKLGYIDIQFLAPRIKAKVMMGIGLMDTICPPSTQFAAYNKINSEKYLKVYPDFGHENIPCHSDVIFEFLRELNN